MAKIYLIEQSLTKSIVSRLCPNILTTKGKTNDFTSGDTAVSPAIIHVKRTDEQRCTDGCPKLEATDKKNRCKVGAQTAS